MVQTKEERSAYNKAYQAKNREQILAQRAEWRQTPQGKKALTKDQWKKRGLNMEQFEGVYQRYLDTDICDNCNCELNQCNSSRKCMDHSHDTGDFRNILCLSCNTRRG